MIKDKYVNAQCTKTAESLTKLLGLKGLSGCVEWNGEQYLANGTPCGESVHGVLEWMKNQPGVKQ